MQACQYKLIGVVKFVTMVLAQCLGFGALLHNCGEKGKVEEKLECRDTHTHQLDK